MDQITDLLVGLLAGVSLALIVTGLIITASLYYLSRDYPAHRRLTWSFRPRWPRLRWPRSLMGFVRRQAASTRIIARRVGVRL